MIVLTGINRTKKALWPGDTFQMTVTDELNCEVVISEEITVYKTIDFIAAYRFALEDGTCPGFHLSGIFGCSNELPIEIQNAVFLEDLAPEQYKNFIESLGAKIEMQK